MSSSSVQPVAAICVHFCSIDLSDRVTISLIPYATPLKAKGPISLDITALRLWLTQENGRLLIRNQLFELSRRTLIFTRFPEDKPTITKISQVILTLAGTEQMSGRTVDTWTLAQDLLALR